MNNVLEGINSRWGRRMDKWPGRQNAGNRCHGREYRKKNEKKQDSLSDLKDIKHINTHIIGVWKEKWPEKIFEEIVAENVPNMGMEIVNQVQESQSSRQEKPKENMLRHKAIQLTTIKNRDKTWKGTRGKWQITYKGTPIKLSADFSTENRNSASQNGMSWLFKVMEEKSLQWKILCPARLSLRLDREIKRQAEVKRMQHHQISFTTNAKGTSLSGKHNRRERPT